MPEYRSAVYSPVVVQIQQWESKYAYEIEKISAKRAKNRIENYLIPVEMRRVYERLQTKEECSIRFGNKKEGHGYHGARGDFCLVGGSINGRRLTVMYRSLELIGGFGYDLCLIQRLGEELNIDWKSVMILAARAHVFALKGNSNEKLFPKLREVFSK